MKLYNCYAKHPKQTKQSQTSMHLLLFSIFYLFYLEKISNVGFSFPLFYGTKNWEFIYRIHAIKFPSTTFFFHSKLNERKEKYNQRMQWRNWNINIHKICPTLELSTVWLPKTQFFLTDFGTVNSCFNSTPLRTACM